MVAGPPIETYSGYALSAVVVLSETHTHQHSNVTAERAAPCSPAGPLVEFYKEMADVASRGASAPAKPRGPTVPVNGSSRTGGASEVRVKKVLTTSSGASRGTAVWFLGLVWLLGALVVGLGRQRP